MHAYCTTTILDIRITRRKFLKYMHKITNNSVLQNAKVKIGSGIQCIIVKCITPHQKNILSNVNKAVLFDIYNKNIILLNI